jgi:hypothetical protein
MKIEKLKIKKVDVSVRTAIAKRFASAKNIVSFNL